MTSPGVMSKTGHAGKLQRARLRTGVCLKIQSFFQQSNWQPRSDIINTFNKPLIFVVNTDFSTSLVRTKIIRNSNIFLKTFNPLNKDFLGDFLCRKHSDWQILNPPSFGKARAITPKSRLHTTA